MEMDDFTFVGSGSEVPSQPYEDPFYYPSSNESEKASILDSYSVHNWYTQLSHLTFFTEFVPLEPSDVQALLSASHAKVGSNGADLAQLKERLAEKINSVQKSSGCTHVFVRLGSISPKDAVFSLEKTHKELVKRLKEDATKLEDVNHQMLLLQEVSHDNLKVSSAEEAIHLLTSSTRVWNDLLSFNSSEVSTCIAVREWRHFEISEEFRTFISPQNTLTAIGQYYHFLHFAQLSEDYMKSVKETIEEFFDSALKPELQKYCPCVADLIVTRNPTGSLKATMLEINPFGRGTGAGLFSWDKDQDLLLNGPTQVRFRTEPREHFEGVTLLPKAAHDLLATALVQ